MYGIDLRVIGAVVLSLLIFLAGWFINGNRWDAKYSNLQRQYAESVVKAQQAAKKAELELQAKADQQVINKNEQIKSISNQLDRALVELRKRPARMPVPDVTRSGQGSTGSSLYREDAEFLIREAARADEVVAQLQYCYRMYDAARDKLKGN